MPSIRLTSSLGIKRALRVLPLVVLVAIVAAALTSGVSQDRPTRYVRVAGSYPDYAVEELVASADAIAIVTPVGDPAVHWNSRANEPWALDGMGVQSHIYRDQPFQVRELLRGSLRADELVLRGLGGSVGDIEMEYEDDIALRRGQTYLALLELVETPTREGIEKAWVPVHNGHGLFEASGDGVWSNFVGKQIMAEELIAPPGASQ